MIRSFGIVGLMTLTLPVFAQVCTKEDRPVCGVDGVTYANPCMAQSVPLAYEGECVRGPTYHPKAPSSQATCMAYYDGCNSCTQSDGGYPICTKMFCEKPGRPYCHEQNHESVREEDMIVCTMEYRPVCGMIDGQVRTFGNQCELNATKGAVFLHARECVTTTPDSLSPAHEKRVKDLVTRLISLSPRTRHALVRKIHNQLQRLASHLDTQSSETMNVRYRMLAYVLESLSMHH